jgi:CheY-like chemotaxis protein
VGVGTTVRLYLPRAHQEAEVAEPAPATTAMPRSRNETVLVVEDNPDVRALAIHHLGDLGYSVIEAENGPLALAALESHGEIDLLFTDMVMPGGMTGIELSAMALKLHPHLKVLYTTGFAAAATGNSRFTVTGKLITKPYRKSALAVKVREVLDS